MLTVQQAFEKAGFNVKGALTFGENCGYWEDYPVSDDGGTYWWDDGDPFISDDDFASGPGFVRTHDMMMMDVPGLPLNNLPASDAMHYLPQEVKAVL